MIGDHNRIKVFTIGAYGFTEAEFLAGLKSKNIDTFCDIRLRRGMRGSRYSWANSTHLQAALKNIGISYVYLKELCPTKEIREEQKKEDLMCGVSKHERTRLGKAFSDLYSHTCLTEQNISKLFNALPASSKNIVFFCVEKEPEACHRSILANYLCGQFSLNQGGDIR